MIKRMRQWVDDALLHAHENKSCFTAWDAIERKRMQRAACEGLAIEVAPQVFADPASWKKLKPRDRSLWLMKALQSLHPNWVFAGPSAAVAHGLEAGNRYLDKVWVGRPRSSQLRETWYYRSLTVSNVSVQEVGGLRVTPLARTVGDCLRVMSFRFGLAVADSALRLSGMSCEQMSAEVAQACRRTADIGRVMGVVSLADGRAESGGESVARAVMLEVGIAAPELQREVPSPLDPDGTYRVDFSWEIGGKYILGELDGHEKYTDSSMTGGKSIGQIIDEEHRRQSSIEAAENVLRMVRFGYVDVVNEQRLLGLLTGCGVPRNFAADAAVVAAGGTLRCRG